MYVLSMLRGNVLARCLLVSTALGCHPTTRSSIRPTPHPAAVTPQDKPRTLPETRLQIAVAVTHETILHMKEFGFAVDESKLKVQVAEPQAFVEGLVKNAAHFEIPGLFDALSAIARLFALPSGTKPEELRMLARQAIGEATLAYYDHVSKTLVFRDDPSARMLNPESLIAHELGHAYQDQAQGGLEEFIRAHRGSLDGLRAAHGVLEGQAVVIGSGVEWFQQGIAIDRLDPDLADASVGRLASGEAFSVVYETGRRFMLKRYREGGWQSVADAFYHPPTSTEQLLHPEKFRRDLPTVVALPRPPRVMDRFPIVFDGTVGELLLYNRLLLVARDLNKARLAAAGWDGDHIQVFAMPDGGYGVLWRILWDRPGDAEQFESVVGGALKGRKWVGLRRRERVTDLVYAETRAHFAALTNALAAQPSQFPRDRFDSESTAAVESAWQQAELRRAYVDANRWVLPEYGLSFQIPNNYVAVTIRGVDLLATLPQEGFANNVSLVYEQDLFDGDIERYLREAQRQARMTSQRWLEHHALALGKSKAAIVELEVPSGQQQMRLAMLILLRSGRWVTITCATLARRPDEARKLLGGIVQSLRLE